MVAWVRAQVAAVLGVTAGAELPGARQRLFDLGLDSLMALELRNRLEAELQLGLANTLVFDYGTIDALAEHLNQRLTAPQNLDAATDEEIEHMLAAELGRAGAAS